MIDALFELTKPEAARRHFWEGLTIRGMMAIVAAVSLLFAAVAGYSQRQRAMREAWRKILCLNNLKLLGHNIYQYETIHKNYPPGTVPNPDLPPGRRLGWGVKVYLLNEEGCSGCPSADTMQAWDDPDLQFAARSRSWTMSCPSCPQPTAAGPPVPANYVGIAGLGVDAPGLPKEDRRAGIFGDDRTVSPADVTDGLANTMMVAESSAPSGPWFAGGRATVRGLDPSRKPYLGPCRQFGGIHGEGANVLMADGSVRWVRPTPTGRGFEAMSTIAGGEVIADPDDSP